MVSYTPTISSHNSSNESSRIVHVCGFVVDKQSLQKKVLLINGFQFIFKITLLTHEIIDSFPFHSKKKQFNFVGKLLGPKGNSMKRLQEDTMCKMAVLGRGSMKDRKKEEELRLSGDPRYTHLFEDLHVEISTFAAPAEAYARIAYSLAEVRRFLVPVSIQIVLKTFLFSKNFFIFFLCKIDNYTMLASC